VGAVLGNSGGSVPAAVRDEVRTMIDQTTGMQTILQMEYLIDIILRHGYVPREKIKTPAAYKAIYLKELMKEVSRRAKAVKAGTLSVEEVTMRGSVDFLKKLHDMGVKLYLASGTDVDSVVEEAALLGYGPLFEGRIYGAEHGVREDAKKRVMRTILADIGDGSRLAVFGDGMVEMREGKKAGALTVGVASNEERRHGLNRSKRTRLIRGGADIIIPDFANTAALMALLF